MTSEQIHGQRSMTDNSQAISDLAHTIHLIDRRAYRATLRRAEVEMFPSLVGEMLDFIIDNPGCRIQDAADSLVIKPSNASSYVSALAAEGLVTKYQDPADRRQVRLRPTPTAVEHSLHIDQTWVDLYRNALVELDDQALTDLEAAMPAIRELGKIVSAQISEKQR